MSPPRDQAPSTFRPRRGWVASGLASASRVCACGPAVTDAGPPSSERHRRICELPTQSASQPTTSVRIAAPARRPVRKRRKKSVVAYVVRSPRNSGFAIRIASGSGIAKRCRASCLCCTRGLPGGICRWSSGLARERPAGAVSTSGRRPGCGTRCTSCCWPSCNRQASSSGHAPS
jgi:hypothetical protein